MDVVGGFLITNGTHAKALTGIDDHSRFCVSATLMARERTLLVCETPSPDSSGRRNLFVV